MVNEVLTLDLFVDYHDPIEALKRIVRELKLDWDVDKITYDDKSTGYLNRNLKVYVPGNKDALLLRLMDPGFDDSLIDFQKHMQQFIDQAGLGPKLYCFVQNGFCVEFLHGVILTWDNRKRIDEDKIWPMTADILAKFHCKDTTEKAQKFGIGERSFDIFTKVFLPAVNTTKQSDPNSKFCQEMPSGDELIKEWEWYVRTSDKLSPKKTFTHMDPNPTNWVLRENDAVLIDYDLSSIFYRSADLAWYFLVHCDPRLFNLDEYPSLEFQRAWLKRYLTKLRELDGIKEPVKESDIDNLLAEIEIGLLYALLQFTFGTMSVIAVTQKAGKEAISEDCGLTCWSEFKKRKAKLRSQGFE